MSYSTLYGITSDLRGVELSHYHNSWLFGPAIWGFLETKYHTDGVIGFTGTDGQKQLNDIMNKGENLSEQICWELSNQQVFCTKDKELVAECIDNFIYVASLVGTYDVEIFHKVATDIRNLDESEYPFFVFKNTSVDDAVESWFYKSSDDELVDCSLLESPYFENELVVIDRTNKCVDRFINPDEFKMTYKQYM